MFLTSASGGLIALGLVATATGVGTAFYAFGLVLLPTLAFVGLVTFERAVQIGLKDYLLMRRIALLREYYFREAPELQQYLVSVPLSEVLTAGSLLAGREQLFGGAVIADSRRHGWRDHRRARRCNRRPGRNRGHEPLARRGPHLKCHGRSRRDVCADALPGARLPASRDT